MPLLAPAKLGRPAVLWLGHARPSGGDQPPGPEGDVLAVLDRLRDEVLRVREDAAGRVGVAAPDAVELRLVLTAAPGAGGALDAWQLLVKPAALRPCPVGCH
eukprot:7844427-Lingulodinium_polyedra.AAC.1